MSRRTAELGLESITIEGGLIAPEQIAAIAATDRNPRAAADYDIPKGLTLGDEIARFFRIGQAIWREYARIDAPTLTQTAAFVRDLLHGAFGFDDLTGPFDHNAGTRRFRIAWQAKGGRVPVVIAPPARDDKGRDIGFTRALSEYGDGAEGRTRRAPIVLLQDWLNYSDAALWGLVFAGDRVRLMRDNASLTRAAWIEADLAAMFRDEMFADFTAWWLLTHASRFGKAGNPPSAAPLEQAREAGLKQGTAARERLREGVQTALEELGNGLVEASSSVRNTLAHDPAATAALFEELLLTVYRLIFLAVAEERNLLHPRTTPQRARDLYAESYAFGFWRTRSTRRVAYDSHHDAWEGMKITLAALEQGQPLLGLPALGGMFSRASTPTLDGARISNRRFLAAIYALGFITVNSTRTRINWRDMRTEELGSVYESLLEIRPYLAADGAFALDSGAKGNARKTSGSYYTPDSLVETLLDSALDPVLDRAEANGGVDAILDLKVIDPACGSGHFLLGAARRMAERVAILRDPDAPDRQAALRDVVSRCIHGVDRNPMAVELAKVALWIESVSPGQPLGFLDANIRCGDALLGVFDLAALEEGVPDDAYKPLTGDDKGTANGLKKLNKAERDAGLLRLAIEPDRLSRAFRRFHRMPETSPREVAARAEEYARIRTSPDWQVMRQACDAYVAAFLLPKPALPSPQARSLVPTTRHVRDILSGGLTLGTGAMQGQLAAAVDAAAHAARAFHWPVEFPAVLLRPERGFDVVLGNPPWERIKLQEQEFFAGTAVADASNAAARTRAIAALGTAAPGTPDRALYDSFQIAKRVSEAMSLFARVPGDAGGRYRYTGTGDVNTYALFAEHFLNLTRESGRAGVIVPTGIATDVTTAPFFGHLVSERRLARLFDFENRAGLFPAVDSRMKFCLLTIGSGVPEAAFAFFLTEPTQLEDARRRFALSPAEIARINPNTKAAPVFRAREDARLTATVYDRVPVLIDEAKGAAGNPWTFEYMTKMFDMADSSPLFRTAAQLKADGWERERTDWVRPAAIRPQQSAMEPTGGRDAEHLDLSTGSVPSPRQERYIPLYEAKMIGLYDHRAGSYAGRGADRGYRVLPETSAADYQDPRVEAEPFYWLSAPLLEARLADRNWRRPWLMGWKDVAAVTNERTAVATVFPRIAVAHTIRVMFADGEERSPVLLSANLSSLTADYIVRQKFSGLHLTVETLKQLPILPPSAYTEADLAFIVPRVLELAYTSHAMAPFARDLGYAGPPFTWDEDRRAQLRAELDAWYALAYGLSRDELRYVLDPRDVMGADYPSETFRVLQKNEIAKYGEYRTRGLVLAAYDELAAAAPDTSEVDDALWERQLADEIDVRHLLAGLVRRMRQPRPTADVLRAFVLAAQPNRLTRHLTAERQAEWRRLVGAEAELSTSGNVVSIGAGHLGKFGESQRRLTADEMVRYDTATGLWDRGAAIYSMSLPPWAEGRADFVWHAMQAIPAASMVAGLSLEEQEFLARAAA